MIVRVKGCPAESWCDRILFYSVDNWEITTLTLSLQDVCREIMFSQNQVCRLSMKKHTSPGPDIFTGRFTLKTMGKCFKPLLHYSLKVRTMLQWYYVMKFGGYSTTKTVNISTTEHVTFFCCCLGLTMSICEPCDVNDCSGTNGHGIFSIEVLQHWTAGLEMVKFIGFLVKVVVRFRCHLKFHQTTHTGTCDQCMWTLQALVAILTHSSSAAASPSPPAWELTASALLAMILSVHDAPASVSPAKLHLVTVPLSTLAKETVGAQKRGYQLFCLLQVEQTTEK